MTHVRTSFSDAHGYELEHTTKPPKATRKATARARRKARRATRQAQR